MPKTSPVATVSRFNRVFPYLIIVCSAIALICSFVLTYDKMELLKNPNFVPSCNLNPVLSCGSVMHTEQSSAFGFPNPWIGLVAFSVFLTVGVVMIAGTQLKRWFWIAYEAGLGLAMVFAYWLLIESIYAIGALCPFCLIVDVALTAMFWYGTLYLIDTGHIRVPKRLAGLAAFARKHHLEILTTWFILLIALILQHFWYYYGQFI